MKNTFILVAMFLFAVSAMAAKPQFRKITAKTCDGQEMPVEKNEIIMLDLERSEIGIGSKSENGCAHFDTMSTLTVIPSSKAKPVSTLEAVEPVGHKSTCSSSLKPYQGMQFQTVTVEKSQVTLSHTGTCARLALTLE